MWYRRVGNNIDQNSTLLNIRSVKL